jgi:hypothetical protein
MKAVIVRFVAGLALVAGAAGTAAADSRCSDVNIQVKNDYRDPVSGARVDIKVVDFEYYDLEDIKWREEWSDNKRINPNQTEVWTKNLEYVGGESGVKIKVFFKYDQSGGRWSTTHTKTSSAFTCVDGYPILITVN